MQSHADSSSRAPSSARPDFDRETSVTGLVFFFGLLAAGVTLVVYSFERDLAVLGVSGLAFGAVVLLGGALFVALGFEFVNGFHDTANAVATVIYTHALPPTTAVVWSGVWNFLGVLSASGAVAYGIISLLPVELILQADSGAGFAMVFALLLAAMLWNLGTWWLGLPSSSSHTLIGSIIGVGIANQLMNYTHGTSGVDWGKAEEIGLSLLFSPLMGFVLAGLLLLVLKQVVKSPSLYQEPRDNAPPPFWTRSLLILTCTLVSFFHGSNDGQKGMGLIMLILIGTVPTVYALNRSISVTEMATFVEASAEAQVVVRSATNGRISPADPLITVEHYLQTRELMPETLPALAALIGVIGDKSKSFGTFANVPAAEVSVVRSEMYIASEALRVLMKSGDMQLDQAGKGAVVKFKTGVDQVTRFIPTWVKIVIAIALGLGTMVGWKRIVVTVGEKIGKTHLTYAQGASAELVAAGMIGVADGFGLPVSTTHVLSSGVAGTMAANGSGLQMSTLRSLAIAWVLTLPVSMLLSGTLFLVFSRLF